MGPPATIPKVLEVEELIVRSDDSGAYMRLVGGSEGKVAKIEWYTSGGQVVAQIWGGSTRGMVLSNCQNGRWSEFCIEAEQIGPCPPWEPSLDKIAYAAWGGYTKFVLTADRMVIQCLHKLEIRR